MGDVGGWGAGVGVGDVGGWVRGWLVVVAARGLNGVFVCFSLGGEGFVSSFKCAKYKLF